MTGYENALTEVDFMEVCREVDCPHCGKTFEATFEFEPEDFSYDWD